MKNNARSFQSFPLVLIVALIVIAPFLGGTREVYGTSALCMMALTVMPAGNTVSLSFTLDDSKLEDLARARHVGREE